MSANYSNGKRITVWVVHYADRPYLLLQWVDPDTGMRKSQSAGTCNPKDAEQARADLEYELNNGLRQGDGRVPWEKFRERFWAEYVAPLRQNTRDNYEDTLNLFEELCRPKRLDLVTAATVSAFAGRMRAARLRGGKVGMEPSTIKVRLQYLHTALQWAVGVELLKKVPRFPRVEVAEPDPQPVAAEAFERLLEKAGDDAQMHAYLLCGWLAGLRLAEAFFLEWGPTDAAPWVDLARDRVWLPLASVKGKRDQWVPLDPQLRAALEALPRHGPRVFRFLGRKGPVTVYGQSQRVRLLAKAAGVKLTMKSLRRGFGCRYAGKVPAQVLQKLMRHRDIKTTLTYYANVDVAVEEAVLGPQHNRLHNSGPRPADGSRPASDATTSPDQGLSP
jgi:integrase